MCFCRIVPIYFTAASGVWVVLTDLKESVGGWWFKSVEDSLNLLLTWLWDHKLAFCGNWSKTSSTTSSDVAHSSPPHGKPASASSPPSLPSSGFAINGSVVVRAFPDATSLGCSVRHTRWHGEKPGSVKSDATASNAARFQSMCGAFTLGSARPADGLSRSSSGEELLGSDGQGWAEVTWGDWSCCCNKTQHRGPEWLWCQTRLVNPQKRV